VPGSLGSLPWSGRRCCAASRTCSQATGGRAEKAVQITELVGRAGSYRVVDPGAGVVVGTLDVESGERDAFTDADRHALERIAAASRGLFA
jgi:hypothetical protein